MMAGTTHLCIDMQYIFKEKTSWHMEWMPRVLPRIQAVTSHYCADTIFTRFIPVQQPGDGIGTWRDYYQRWPEMTLQNLESRMLDIVAELTRIAPSAPIIDKQVYAPWLETDLHQMLQKRGTDTLVITGGETDICVLATVAGAVDLGYKIILVEDAVCGSTDETHDAILKIYRERYSMQVNVIKTETLAHMA